MMNHNPLIKSPADSPSQHTQDDAPLAKDQQVMHVRHHGSSWIILFWHQADTNDRNPSVALPANSCLLTVKPELTRYIRIAHHPNAPAGRL